MGLQGGDTLGLFQLPENIASSSLSGHALRFDPLFPQEQIRWNRNGPESSLHYVGFDFYAEQGANLTFFLDLPSILRFDLNQIRAPSCRRLF